VIWSPDGERLLTIREGNDGGFALWTFRRDGGDLRRLWSGPGYWTADWR
jgi:Tol biopolymer transport system component